MTVSVGRYVLGVASLVIVCASLALAAVALRRRLLPDWWGAPARLAEGVAGLSGLIVMLELLGALGLFRLGPIVALCALAGLAGGWDMARRRRLERRGTAGARALIPVAVAVAAGATAAAVWASPVLEAYDFGIRPFDSLWYHMPWAATFAQTGRVTSLHFDLEFLLAFYPATAELFHGLGIVLLGRDTLSPALNLPWMGGTMLAAWCIGHPRGRAAAAAAGVALVLLTPMMDLSQPGSADGDVVGLFFLLAASALMLNSAGAPSAYVLAALSAGFAASIKLTFLAPVLALTLGVLLAAARGRRARTAAAWLLPLLGAGGFWYVRNLIAIGNPLPWSSFGGVLPTPAPPLQHQVDFAVAHYLTNSQFWKHFFVSGMAAQLGRWWYVIAAVAVLGPVLCLLPGADRALRMLAVVALASLAAYLVTPNSAIGPDGDPVGFTYNLRYAAPGLALAYAITPLAPALAGSRRQAALLAGLGAVIVATVAQPSLWPSRHLAGALTVGGATLAAGLLLARVRPRRAAPVLALAALLVCAGAAAGYPWQRHYLRGRYAYQPQVSHLAPVWAYFRGVHHARVAVAGTYGEFFSYPLFGIDDSNRVQYVAQAGPRGSFTRIATCRAWRAALNRGHFRYLLTTPERDFWRPAQLRPAPERAWVVADPAARELFEFRVTGQPVDVFELRDQLSLGGCPRATG